MGAVMDGRGGQKQNTDICSGHEEIVYTCLIC